MKNYLATLKKGYHEPGRAIKKAISMLPLHSLEDDLYLKVLYYVVFGKMLDLTNPKTYTEKIQWLKLYDRNPLYSMLADKLTCRDYVRKLIGEEHLIPLVGGPWLSVDEIDFCSLPNQYVLKCTHDSGSAIICDNVALGEQKKILRRLDKSLNKNLFYDSREWVYRSIVPQIIAEKLLLDNYRLPNDFKFFCFDGEPCFVNITSGRDLQSHTVYNDYFDIDFIHQPFTFGNPNAILKPSKPENFDELVQYARLLSKGIRHVRVDLYCIQTKIYFGELTFYPQAGLVKIRPEKYDEIIGKLVRI